MELCLFGEATPTHGGHGAGWAREMRKNELASKQSCDKTNEIIIFFFFYIPRYVALRRHGFALCRHGVCLVQAWGLPPPIAIQADFRCTHLHPSNEQRQPNSQIRWWFCLLLQFVLPMSSPVCATALCACISGVFYIHACVFQCVICYLPCVCTHAAVPACRAMITTNY